MSLKQAFLIFAVMSLAFAGFSSQNIYWNWDERYATMNPQGVETDTLVLPQAFGDLIFVNISNANGANYVDVLLLDESGGTILSTSIAPGGSYQNRSNPNYTVYGKMSLRVANNYSNALPTGNLTSYWKLDDGSGGTSEDSVGNNTLDVINALWTTAGKIANGTLLDGATDYLRVNHSTTTALLTPFSVALWAAPTGANTGAYLFSKGNLSASEQKSLYLRLGYNNATNSSVVNATINQVATAFASNTTALENASGSRTLALVRPANSSSYSATLNVTVQVGTVSVSANNSTLLSDANGSRFVPVAYAHVNTVNTTATLQITSTALNGTNVSVSVNGINYGLLEDLVSNFTVNQTDLTASTNVTLSSDASGVNVSLIKLTYTANPTVTLALGGVSYVLNVTTNSTFSVPMVNLGTANTLTFTPDLIGTNVTAASIGYTQRTPLTAQYTFANGTNFDGSWHHFALAYNGSRISLFADGANVANSSNSAGTTETSTGPLYFGDGANSSAFLTGKLDEIYLFNDALNGTAVSYLQAQRSTTVQARMVLKR